MINSSMLNLYQTRLSLIHKLDPRVKLIATIGLILSNVMLPDGAWIIFGITWMLILILSSLSKVESLFILKRSLIAIPFTLMAISVVFSIPGEPITVIKIFNTELIITEEGLIRFISIMIRAWLSIQATILLTATTTFPDLAHALRHLRVPVILIAILSFTYRYLFVLNSEAKRLLQARSARSASLPGSKKPSMKWNANNAGSMIGQLFLRSYERSDRVYDAMVARGFQGQFLTFNPHQMTTKDWIALLIITLLLLAIQLMRFVI